MNKKTRRIPIIDRVIEYFSPKRGRLRLEDRQAIDYMRRAYNAADRGRRTAGWNAHAGKGVNSELRKSLPLMRERSRDLVRNNPWAASIKSEIVANMIHHGIIACFSTKNNAAAGIKVPGIWSDWAESPKCDARKQKDFYDIQRLLAGMLVESGEFFVRRIVRDDWKPGEQPFALQVLEPEYIDQSKDGADNTKMGIKFDQNGAPLGYWVYKNHPSEAASNESFFVSTEEMIHVFVEERAGQIRGVPFLVPSALRLYDLDTFEQAELVKQEVSAMYSAFRKRTEPGYGGTAPDNDETRGSVGNQLEPGLIETLDVGEDIVFANPPQRTGYGEYIKQNLLAIAAGVGLTYENASGDYGKVTFLNGRMGQLRFFRRIDQLQFLAFIPKFCDRVAEWFKEGAMIAGVDLSDTVIRWQTPTKQMVDPEREAKAAKEMVRSGSMTPFELIRGMGNDPLPFLDEYAVALEEIRKRKLVFTTDVERVSDAGQVQAINPDREDNYEAESNTDSPDEQYTPPVE